MGVTVFGIGERVPEVAGYFLVQGLQKPEGSTPRAPDLIAKSIPPF